MELPYKMIADYRYAVTGDINPKKYLGNKGACMFCGRSSSEVGFSHEAHAIPRGLGNQSLINLSECNDCNDLFSRHDEQLVKISEISRSFSGGRGRNGSPIYVPAKGSKSRIERKGNNINISFAHGEPYFSYTVNSKDETLSLIFALPPIRMVGLNKALVHMGISLAKEEITARSPFIIDWLLGSFSILPLHCDITFLGQPFAYVFLEVWVQNNEVVKDYPALVRFFYGMVAFTFYIPSNGDVAKINPPPFTWFNQAIEGNQSIRHRAFEDEVTKNIKITVSLKVPKKSLEELINSFSNFDE